MDKTCQVWRLLASTKVILIVWALVDVDTTAFEAEAEEIDIVLPKLLLKRIDDYTHAKHLTRSVFLAEAARAAMR